jgi:hypothetical protein
MVPAVQRALRQWGTCAATEPARCSAWTAGASASCSCRRAGAPQAHRDQLPRAQALQPARRQRQWHGGGPNRARPAAESSVVVSTLPVRAAGNIGGLAWIPDSPDGPGRLVYATGTAVYQVSPDGAAATLRYLMHWFGQWLCGTVITRSGTEAALSAPQWTWTLVAALSGLGLWAGTWVGWLSGQADRGH